MQSELSDQSDSLDIHETLKEMTGMIRRMLGPAVIVEQHLDAPFARVRLRPGQFEKVIMDLAVHARHAMPAGGRFEVRTSLDPWGDTRAEGTAGDLIVQVSDTGIGIPCGIQGQIFDQCCTTRPHGEGAGVGLSTLYGILKDAGGAVSVSSTLGRGATFKIRLPLA
jgi:two-component system cell cycle sensor histidine kinase/response regulator CckA